MNGAGEAYDTLKELGDLINENVDAIDALETIATNKADKEHTHSWNDLTDKPFYEGEDGKLYLIEEKFLPIATDEDIMAFLSEMNLINPVTSSDGSVYTNADGDIYTL